MTFIFLQPNLASASVPQLKIVPEKSFIHFTAIQNDAPVKGEFTKFSGDIAFDPNQLDQSHVVITVDMNSVKSTYQDIDDTLKMSEWFDVSRFPQATFDVKKFVHVDGKNYEAQGVLTIRDKKVDLTLPFTLSEFSKTSAVAKGKTTIKRLMFGVGQGEWASTGEIKDDVVVEFEVTAVPQS